MASSVPHLSLAWRNTITKAGSTTLPRSTDVLSPRILTLALQLQRLLTVRPAALVAIEIWVARILQKHDATF